MKMAWAPEETASIPRRIETSIPSFGRALKMTRAPAARPLGGFREIRPQNGDDFLYSRGREGLEDRLQHGRAAEGEQDLLALHPAREAGRRHDSGEDHFFLAGIAGGPAADSRASACSHRRPASSLSIAPRRAWRRDPAGAEEERRRRTSSPSDLSRAKSAARCSPGGRTSRKATRARRGSLPCCGSGAASQERNSLLPAAVTR